jgi:hypothetical protein
VTSPSPDSLAGVAAKLGFSLEELALNRSGQLSSHQTWEAVRMALFPVGLALVFVGMFMALLFLVRPGGLGRLIFAIPIVGFILMVGLSWHFGSAAWSPKVRTAEGALRFQQGRGGPHVVVDGVWAQSSPRQAATILQEGKPYRLYYLERSRQFLSIEPVSEGP